MIGCIWVVNLDNDLDFLKIKCFFKNLDPYMVLFLTSKNKVFPVLENINYKLINIKKNELNIFNNDIYCLDTDREYSL